MSDRSPQQAVILVGGLGTRLRPLTYRMPKALLPVVNRPLVSYALEWLRRAGVRQIILAVAHQAEALAAGLGDGSDWGVELRYVAEKKPLDTAGALRNCAEYLQGRFWALNGDLIFDFDPGPMVAQHVKRQALVSLTMRQVSDVAPFGSIRCDDGGRVTAFLEKIQEDPTGQNTVNAGIYLMEPEALARVPAGRPYSNERQLFPELVAEGATVLGYLPQHMAYWADVGRVDSYLQANRDLLDGAISWVGPGVAETAQVSAQAELVPPCHLAQGVMVCAGARVGPHVSVGADAVVGTGARIRESVVLPQAKIGEYAQLESVIVGPGETVPEGYQEKGRIISHG